jgi:hypothetical protein
MSLAATESAPSEASFETFDNFEEIAEEAEASGDDDWGKEEAPAKEKVSEDLKVIKDSQVDGEGKVIKDDKESDKDEEEESEEEESEEEESEEEEEIEVKKEEEEKKDSKKLRMRMGDELFNVDSDASFKVKVDGQNVDVPLQELINNYSGKTAWDKKFTEIGKEKKTLEVEKSQVTKQSEELKRHVAAALAPLKTKDGNPMDSLLYLVEMSGDDPYNAYRRIMESNLGELGKLMDMGDVERELYFHKKKDELHLDVAKKRQGKIQEEQTFNQVVQRVDSLRQTFNVSEDAYVDASDELEEIYAASKLDVNDITHEAIVDYASLRPHIAVVKGLIEQYEDNISEGKYGDIVAELSRHLRDGKSDEATIKKLLARNFSVEEDVKELNSKVYGKSAKAPVKKALKEESKSFESFDDWE